MDRARLAEFAYQRGIPLDDEVLDRFEAFEAALYARNEVMNLTRVPREECWLRHFLDSLLIAPLLPSGGTVLDIGTGPGFPAWPLAVARPGVAFTALDSSGKMLGFLASQPLPNLEIVQGRAEEWEERDAFDVVTGRALAPLAIQAEVSAGLVKIGGAFIPMRTPNDDPEGVDLSELGLKLERVATAELPVLDAPRTFPIYRKLEATSDFYPRPWAEIKKAPLTLERA
ncbi:16S rRNA (guanine(527)-N(7))-methyltransferase RsmG [bacterium]|nr:MAG: 16S rRNA (guanine(527)-N(7))-methyltransferase RsmG [bacterium]